MDFFINKQRTIIVISSTFAILIIALLVMFIHRNNLNKKIGSTTKETPQPTNSSLALKEVLTKRDTLRSSSSSLIEKTAAIRELKKISLEESYPKHLRQLSGELVTSNFFNYGMTLTDGFLSASTPDEQKKDVERQIYEYSKYVNTLGDGPLNPLLTAYIGLRFYPEEMDAKTVSGLLNSSIRYTDNSKSYKPCPILSKRASVIYLASKNKNTNVNAEFGDYYSNFEKAYNACKDDKNSLVTFMWVAAISDIGTTAKEKDKANQLIAIITNDTTSANPLVVNLKSSYFTEPQEPDTVSIVRRLQSKYPKFDLFIKNIK